MAKIPFNINKRPEIEAGKYKVVTRSGLPVTIYRWDFKEAGGTCILGSYMHSDGNEYCAGWQENGRFWETAEDDYDLFLDPTEPELTEFERKLWEIMKAEGSPVGPREKFTNDDKRAFHEYSAQLLSLARNEIVKSGYAIIEGEHYLEEGRKNYERGKAEALKEIEQDPESSYAFKRGVEYGKEEALKDLPRWVKVDEGVLLDKCSKYLLYSNGVYYCCCGTTITRDGYMLLVDNLEKLPKE